MPRPLLRPSVFWWECLFLSLIHICKELANAYSELNDPLDQEERFKEQMRLADKGDDEAMIIDQDYKMLVLNDIYKKGKNTFPPCIRDKADKMCIRDSL